MLLRRRRGTDTFVSHDDVMHKLTLTLFAAGAALLACACGSAHGAITATTQRSTPAQSTAAPHTPGDEAFAASWVDPAHGWLLVGTPCRGGAERCAVVYTSPDAGRSWTRLARIPAQTAHAGIGNGNCTPGRTCVDGIVFASRTVGYAYGPSLFMTVDGGRSWQRISGRAVESMAAAGSWAYRLTDRASGCPGPCTVQLERSHPGSHSWQRVSAWTSRSVGFGEQMLAAGQNVYTVFYGHIAGGTASHAAIEVSSNAGSTWATLADPCGGTGLGERDTGEAAAAGNALALLCVPKGGTAAAFTETSVNAGGTFTRSAPSPVSRAQQIAVEASGDSAVGNAGMEGSGRFTYQLAVDGRLAVSDRRPLPAPGLATGGVLAFVSPSQLVWVGEPHVIWTSSDAGATWRHMLVP